jgi:hypothetical protein
MPDDESLTLKSFRARLGLLTQSPGNFTDICRVSSLFLARVRAQAAASLVRLQGY